MTEKQINEILVTDVTRIMNAGRRLAGCSSWKDKELKIVKMLNAGKEHELRAAIEAIVLEKCGAKGASIDGIFSRTYINNILTLLRYREEKAEHKNSQIKLNAGNYDYSEYITQIINRLKTSRSTVTGYRAIELAGSEEELARRVTEKFGAPVRVTVEKMSDPSFVYREKNAYLGHRIWATTQLLPVVKLEIVQ